MLKLSKKLFPAFIQLILLVLFGCQSADTSTLQADADRIVSELVPDKRIVICSINAKKGKDGTVILNGECSDVKIKSEVIKALDASYNNLIDSIIVLPDTINIPRFYGVATLSVINLRREPDHASELVSQALLGTPVRILKEDHSWILIQTPDRYLSWTEKSSVKLMDHAQMTEWKNRNKIVFTGSSGWIHCKPDDSCIVSDVVAGCIMGLLGETKNFVSVILPDGREGFLNKKEVKDFSNSRNEAASNGESIVKRASTLLGVPYLWGGSSSKGVDCSGLVQNVFFMNGMILQRDASQQARHGNPIEISSDFDQLEPGDLLFFGSRQRIVHVAIYKGNKEYIHASGRVMINSLDSLSPIYSRYRRSSLVKALRIINCSDSGIVRIKDHPWY
jgi:gamma-D-glutamyl-L-lysine dipeptidyl-peptidase